MSWGLDFISEEDFINHVGEKTHGFNREDDSPPLYLFTFRR